jgi:hypothetical protein
MWRFSSGGPLTPERLYEVVPWAMIDAAGIWEVAAGII